MYFREMVLDFPYIQGKSITGLEKKLSGRSMLAQFEKKIIYIGCSRTQNFHAC